MKPNGSA